MIIKSTFVELMNIDHSVTIHYEIFKVITIKIIKNENKFTQELL